MLRQGMHNHFRQLDALQPIKTVIIFPLDGCGLSLRLDLVHWGGYTVPKVSYQSY